MLRNITVCIFFLCGSIVYAGSQEVRSIEIGQLFQSNSQGKLFSAKIKTGIDFNVWYSPRQEEDQRGNIGQVGHEFSYGPLKSKDIKLEVIR